MAATHTSICVDQLFAIGFGVNVALVFDYPENSRRLKTRLSSTARGFKNKDSEELRCHTKFAPGSRADGDEELENGF